jgi:prepilin-type processing-associated H-X9-DG protein
MGWSGHNSHLADGPVPQPNRSNELYYDPPSSKRVKSWKARTSFKSISDGLSQTIICGEVGRGTSERGHAFNGDHFPGVWVGSREPFCQRCELRPKKATDTGPDSDYGDGGFGSSHSGVINFVMCDGHVQAISRDVDMNIMDRFATRAADDIADLSATNVVQCP